MSEAWHSLPFGPRFFGLKITETTNGVHIGALVKIDKNASLWSGAKIERWYLLRDWYVTELEGNKATLGQDESGKYNAKLVISTNFLTVIKGSQK